jgi:hypothetical protein
MKDSSDKGPVIRPREGSKMAQVMAMIHAAKHGAPKSVLENSDIDELARLPVLS